MATTTLAVVPTEKDLFPHLGLEDSCIYCGVPQTDEEAEDRGVEHVTRDLVALHRIRETLRVDFGYENPGYEADVYDLLCELETATRATAPALTSCPDGLCDACNPEVAR